MKKQILSSVAIAVLAVTAGGCGGNPLVGRWTRTSGTAPITFTTTIAFSADNTATETLAGSGDCSGMQTYSNITWSSSMTSSSSTVTFSGTPTCTGTIACMVAGTTINTNCASSTSSMMTGACTFALSSDQNTLTLSACSGSASGSTVYTRAM